MLFVVPCKLDITNKRARDNKKVRHLRSTEPEWLYEGGLWEWVIRLRAAFFPCYIYIYSQLQVRVHLLKVTVLINMPCDARAGLGEALTTVRRVCLSYSSLPRYTQVTFRIQPPTDGTSRITSNVVYSAIRSETKKKERKTKTKNNANPRRTRPATKTIFHSSRAGRGKKTKSKKMMLRIKQDE